MSRERWFCCACDDWQPVDWNAYGDDLPSCCVCGSDEVETPAEHAANNEAEA